MYRIYLITNLINGKLYVGITEKKIESRFAQHVKSSFKEKPKCMLHNAIKKYGVENFSFELIEDDIPFEKGPEKERYYIKKYNSYYKYKKGYNMTFGGKGTVGYIFTDEVRKKISLAGIGRVFSPERNEKVRQSMIKREYKEEWKESLRNSIGDRTGENNPFYGKKHSDETKQKISETKKGNCPHSEEFKQMISSIHKGVPHTESQIQKMRDSSPLKHSVCQYSMDMELINEFPSLKEAERQTGTPNYNISSCCRGKQKSASGFIWKYK